MLAEDVFAQRFRSATSELEAILSAARPDAKVEIEQTGTFWRGRMQPHLGNTCPFECVLHADQTFDLAMGGLRANRWPTRNLVVFSDLATAAVLGTAIVRQTRSVDTGVELARELRVPLSDQSIWTLRQALIAGTTATEARSLFVDRHFVPYRRD